MSRLLISSHAQDEAVAAKLVAALRGAGFEIKPSRSGPGWRQERGEDLAAASVVLALWSRNSVGRDGELVQEEAELAQKRGVLLNVRIEKVDPPLGFGASPKVALLGWKGSSGSTAFKRLVAAARAVAAGQPQPNIRRVRWGWPVGIGTALLSGLAFLSDVAGLQEFLCRAPGIHQVCGHFELGGVPTPAEEHAWSQLPPGNCDALREHLSKFPNGIYAEESARRLSGITFVSEDHWEKRTRELPLATSSAARPQEREAEARQAAMVRAEEEAATLCNFYLQDGRHQLVGTAVKDPQIQ